MGRSAGEEHQEGDQDGRKAVRCALLAACIPPHCWSLDGPGRCADAEDLAIPRSHLDASHRAHLRALQPVVHEGRRGRIGVLTGFVDTASEPTRRRRPVVPYAMSVCRYATSSLAGCPDSPVIDDLSRLVIRVYAR